MMFKRLVAMFLVITLSVAIDDKFFDESHIPVAPLSNGKHIAGTVVAFYENEFLTTLCLECHEEEEYSKYFVNRIIKFHIYKGLTYKELRPQISELMHKYVKIQDVTFDELQKFTEYV